VYNFFEVHVTVHRDKFYVHVTVHRDKLDVHVTVHRDKFPKIKPTRCANFSNLFWKETPHVSDSYLCRSSGVLHSTHSNGTCHTVLADNLQPISGWNQFHPDRACKLI
jgi:hypothetical protein